MQRGGMSMVVQTLVYDSGFYGLEASKATVLSCKTQKCVVEVAWAHENNRSAFLPFPA